MPGTRSGGASIKARQERCRAARPSLRISACSSSRPRRQVRISVNTTTPSTSGNQPPSQELHAGWRPGTRRRPARTAADQRPAPPGRLQFHMRARRRSAEQLVDQHRAGHRRCRRPRPAPSRLPKPSTSRDHRQHQHPVDPRHVDLADRLARGVPDRHARQVAELDRLPRRPRRRRRSPPAMRSPWPRSPARPSDTAPMRARRGRTDCRPPPDCASSSAPWPEVVEHQRRQHEAVPGVAGSGGGRNGPCRRTAPRRR